MNTANVIICHGNMVTSCFSFGSSGDEMLKAEEQFRVSATALGIPERTIKRAFDTDNSSAFISQGNWSISLISNCNTEEEQLCKKCGTPLVAMGYCTDQTCPYSDNPQDTEWDQDGFVIKKG